MKKILSPRLNAILGALLVTFLWSTSYILTKFGLLDIRPLTFVGIRYIIASIVLLSIALMKGEHRKINEDDWYRFAVLGFLGYTLAQGLQCVGLFYLPSVSVTLILNFTPVTVIILDLLFRQKIPNRDQIIGMILVLAGVLLFFSDKISGYSLTGYFITVVSGLGWAGYMVAGKILFKKLDGSPLGNTAFSMSFGAILLLVSAIIGEGFTYIPLRGWLLVSWLGIVNTALAFFLWNHALQTLEAFELSVLQNTMLIQITILSVIFLGETQTFLKYIYMILVFIGVLIVQIKGNRN